MSCRSGARNREFGVCSGVGAWRTCPPSLTVEYSQGTPKEARPDRSSSAPRGRATRAARLDQPRPQLVEIPVRSLGARPESIVLLSLSIVDRPSSRSVHGSIFSHVDVRLAPGIAGEVAAKRRPRARPRRCARLVLRRLAARRGMINGEGRHQECLHSQGAVAPGIEKAISQSARLCRTSPSVGQAAKDCHSSNFIIYHSAYRHVAVIRSRRWLSLRTHRSAFLGPATLPISVAVRRQQCLVESDVGHWSLTSWWAETNVCARADGPLIKFSSSITSFWGTDALLNRLTASAIEVPAAPRNPRSLQNEIRLHRALATYGYKRDLKSSVASAATCAATHPSPAPLCSISSERPVFVDACRGYERGRSASVPNALLLYWCRTGPWITACLRISIRQSGNA